VAPPDFALSFETPDFARSFKLPEAVSDRQGGFVRQADNTLVGRDLPFRLDFARSRPVSLVPQKQVEEKPK